MNAGRFTLPCLAYSTVSPCVRVHLERPARAEDMVAPEGRDTLALQSEMCDSGQHVFITLVTSGHVQEHKGGTRWYHLIEGRIFFSAAEGGIRGCIASAKTLSSRRACETLLSSPAAPDHVPALMIADRRGAEDDSGNCTLWAEVTRLTGPQRTGKDCRIGVSTTNSMRQILSCWCKEESFTESLRCFSSSALWATRGWMQITNR